MAKPSSPSLVVSVFNELLRTRVFTAAAALAFYFLLAFIPLLLVLSSVLAYLPIPNLFGQLLILLEEMAPPYAMDFVFKIVNSILEPNKGKLIFFGLLGAVWAASGGFSACIDALNIAYDVTDSRPWWRDKLQAIILTITAGGLVVVALVSVMLGPEFGHFVQRYFSGSSSFAHIWPVIRVGMTMVTFILAVNLVYFLGPNLRQRFLATVPGAIFAVILCFAGSAGLSFYLVHMTGYSKTYGAMGAILGLMLWLYLIAVGILIGAELNAELVKRKGRPLKGQRAFTSAARRAI